MVQRLWAVRRQAGSFHQCDVVVPQLAIEFAAVEPHRRLAATGRAPGGADVPEAQALGPETMCRIDVANIQHDVVEAARRFGLGWRLPVVSWYSPWC